MVYIRRTDERYSVYDYMGALVAPIFGRVYSRQPLDGVGGWMEDLGAYNGMDG